MCAIMAGSSRGTVSQYHVCYLVEFWNTFLVPDHRLMIIDFNMVSASLIVSETVGSGCASQRVLPHTLIHECTTVCSCLLLCSHTLYKSCMQVYVKHLKRQFKVNAINFLMTTMSYKQKA